MLIAKGPHDVPTVLKTRVCVHGFATIFKAYAKYKHKF